MYCTKCGAQNPDDGKFCQKCGAALAQAPAPPPPPATAPQPAAAPSQPPAVTTRTSGLAVASLVLGIVGIFLNFLSILAIIFGGVAIAQTSKNPNLKGKGMAIAGLILGIIIVISWIAILVWAGSAFWWLSH
jgi:hypothetical protein